MKQISSNDSDDSLSSATSSHFTISSSSDDQNDIDSIPTLSWASNQILGSKSTDVMKPRRVVVVDEAPNELVVGSVSGPTHCSAQERAPSTSMSISDANDVNDEQKGVRTKKLWEIVRTMTRERRFADISVPQTVTSVTVL